MLGPALHAPLNDDISLLYNFAVNYYGFGWFAVGVDFVQGPYQDGAVFLRVGDGIVFEVPQGWLVRLGRDVDFERAVRQVAAGGDVIARKRNDRLRGNRLYFGGTKGAELVEG